jgi:hypothetical protein
MLKQQIASQRCCFGIPRIKIQSSREVPERSDVFYRVRLIAQVCLCLISENPTRLDQFLKSLFIGLVLFPLLVYE